MFCILSSVPIAYSPVRSQSDLSALPERTPSLGGPTFSRAISVELRYEDERVEKGVPEVSQVMYDS